MSSCELLPCASTIGKQCSITTTHSKLSEQGTQWAESDVYWFRYGWAGGYIRAGVVPNSMLVTLLTQALGTGGARAAAHNNWQAVGTQPEP